MSDLPLGYGVQTVRGLASATARKSTFRPFSVASVSLAANRTHSLYVDSMEYDFGYVLGVYCLAKLLYPCA